MLLLIPIRFSLSHWQCKVGPLTALQHASVQSGGITRVFVKMETAHHTASSTGLGPIPWMLGAKLFARVQRLDTVGSRQSVSEQQCSKSVWGVVRLSVLTGTVLGGGWVPHRCTTPPTFLLTSRSGRSERCERRSPQWCSWLWADPMSWWVGCRRPSGCPCTSSCPCSWLRKNRSNKVTLTAAAEILPPPFKTRTQTNNWTC